MGQRERLMTAAKRCLEERGYARTTSRDLAAAANANIAAVNYHYGSKEELLTAALMETVDAWGGKVVPSGAAAAGEAPAERLRAMWEEVIRSFTTERAMIVATTEALAQAERLPAVRTQIAGAYERFRSGEVSDLHAGGDEREARAARSVHMALTAGLSMQWLVDPENAPSADDVLLGLRAMVRELEGTTGAAEGAADPDGAGTE
ncbi:TetR family transcriptional regulator [Spirillospora sp. NPDC029432]|uniref:TetR/AcrR family transcriptional regulator n=1 Tax=Spirillospora sp. NPDC029432 TaxID=3154599 RepID=UPI003451905F